VPERTIGEESNHHQRFAYVVLGVVFMRHDQARSQRLAGFDRSYLGKMGQFTSYGVRGATAALFANANVFTYSRNNELSQGL
jgi:hypothetical protein